MTLSSKTETITFHIAGSCDQIYKNQRCAKCHKILKVTKNGKSNFKRGTIICEIRNKKSKRSVFKKQSTLTPEKFSGASPCWMYDRN